MSTLLCGDKLFDVERQAVTMTVTRTGLPDGLFGYIKDGETSEQLMSLESLRYLMSEDHLRIHRAGAPRVHPVMQDDPILVKSMATRLAFLTEIDNYAKRYQLSKHIAYDRVKEKHQALASGSDVSCWPSQATFYRSCVAQRRGLPLLGGDKNKGNHTPRYGEHIEVQVADIVQREFLKTESRFTLKSATELCNYLLHQNEAIPREKNLSRKFITKVIFERLTADVIFSRLDPRTRAAKKAVAKHRIRIHHAFQRVEQDAVHLPFYVRTKDGITNSVWLIHAIDCATSMPLGWHLVVGAPNSTSGLLCVESTLFSKKERFQMLGVDSPVDPFGTPIHLIFDNGPEANNERMFRLAALAINPEYCKSHHPHHKPFIERLNGSLKRDLETLPGCTRLDGVDGKRDPIKLGDELMTLEALEKWIVEWYFQSWVTRPLERLVASDVFEEREAGGTPLARFQKMLAQDGFSIPMPISRTLWLHTKYSVEERVLSNKTGVSIQGFNFRGKGLEALIKRYGRRSIKVLVDPDDFRFVQVVDGDELVELVNADVDECTPAFSFDDAKKRMAEGMQKAGAEFADLRQKFRGNVFKDSSTPVRGNSTPKKVGGAKGQSKDVTRMVKERAALDRARDKPLPRVTASVVTSTEDVFDDIPKLSVVNRHSGASI